MSSEPFLAFIESNSRQAAFRLCVFARLHSFSIVQLHFDIVDKRLFLLAKHTKFSAVLYVEMHMKCVAVFALRDFPTGMRTLINCRNVLEPIALQTTSNRFIVFAKRIFRTSWKFYYRVHRLHLSFAKMLICVEETTMNKEAKNIMWECMRSHVRPLKMLSHWVS